MSPLDMAREALEAYQLKVFVFDAYDIPFLRVEVDAENAKAQREEICATLRSLPYQYKVEWSGKPNLAHYTLDIYLVATISKSQLKELIAGDLAWIKAHDANLWASWEAVDQDFPDDLEFEVITTGDETVYLSREAEFALAVYGQSEPRFASWLFDGR